ncbi:MAG: GNAT family N-acetyltransferase [Lachnospiraceae bacterium]|nr:GNAT family N-acetyltransferase [Lachnospiraceae bacterium]
MHRMYENDDITVFWDSDKCRHSRVCVSGNSAVFNFARKPWVMLENGDNKSIWQIVERCPTKALTVTYNHDVKIVFEEENKRSVAILNGEIIGECDYAVTPEGFEIFHTEVHPGHEGKGIAKRLVFKVFEAAERSRQKIISTCSYAKKLLES